MKRWQSQINTKKTGRVGAQSLCAFRVKRKRGVTLIEVIISLALFGILAIPVASFVNGSILMNKKAQLQQEAAQVGQKMLEDILVTHEDGLQIGQGAEEIFTELVTAESGHVLTGTSSHAIFEELSIKETDFTATITFKPVVQGGAESKSDSKNTDLEPKPKAQNPDNYGVVLEIKGDQLVGTNNTSGESATTDLTKQQFKFEVFREYVELNQSAWQSKRLNGRTEPFSILIDAKENTRVKKIVANNSYDKLLKVCIINDDGSIEFKPGHGLVQAACEPDEPNPDEGFKPSTDYLNLKEVHIEVKLDEKLMFETSQVIPLKIYSGNE